MFCSNCGNKVSEGMMFCPSCGKEIKHKDIEKTCEARSNNVGDVARERVEIICPYCGSNRVQRATLPSMAQFVVWAILFGIASLIFDAKVARWSFGIIAIGAFIMAIILWVAKKGEKNVKQWTIHCETCNKNFNIDIPDGRNTITNLKSDNSQNSSSDTFPWE